MSELSNNKYKVKLAAIAKDEAAYLPEWIFHHLGMGFDEIEIYINNTTDNSYRITNSIKRHYSVNVIDADGLFMSSKGKFQTSAYTEIAIKAKENGFTHIMFLDIDEFWTSNNLDSTIKDFLAETAMADVYLFNWFIHRDEELFSPCYKENINTAKDIHLKYLIDLSADVSSYGIHNALGKDISYRRGNGDLVAFDKVDSVKAHLKPNAQQDPYYIIHRVYRSQLEYVSLLSRGRPHGAKIKNNRTGYYTQGGNLTVLSFDFGKLNDYYSRFEKFIEQCNLQHELNEAKDFIIERYQKTLSLVDGPLSQEDINSLSKALNHIDLIDVASVKEKIDRLDLVKIKNKHINSLRDAAVFFEQKSNYKIALKLMLIAQELRPDGPFINKKVDFLNSILISNI